MQKEPFFTLLFSNKPKSRLLAAFGYVVCVLFGILLINAVAGANVLIAKVDLQIDEERIGRLDFRVPDL